ncbi:hypothetical protein CBR_g39417 [Chara braunii]|uniref:Myb-like domain-containing protein n=1 Tax=Chara braunii TaxID=69332 RepID=A0A388LRK9_CHABU|nr:hypothetical protein CBR_g39417 [Chara braunii]|eukprot:GBG84954.1 hypothetical protein CBR_g39417 [Chara braunii]
MGGARSPMPACTTPIESEVRDEGTCRAPVRPQPTVENITRGVSNMRAHNDGREDDGGFGDDADEGMREDVEAGDDDDDIPIRPLGKTGGRGKGRDRGGVCGRSIARGSRGGVSDDDGKSPTYWSAEDQMLLMRCKREQDMHLAGLTHNYGRMKTKEWKWDDMLKRIRASVPRRGVQGWAQAAEDDNDDDFTTEDEQGEATASAVRESGRQRSSNQSASKRMFTPPPEAQQLRIHETWKEKGVVVDLGGHDDEPLEKRRLGTATQATATMVSTARAAADERPITGTLPSTPSQPHQRNDGANGASVQRGGGGGVMADARAAGGKAAGGAGVGVAGVVVPVLAAKEEAAVPAMAREEGPGQNKNERDGGEAASSRARRGVMTKELIDRALLLVDDKAFWNRPRGYHLAFQYSLESVATNIARAMWYGEEWCNVVSAAICVHTINLNMDLPLWYAGANIEDRPKDDDMAAHQEVHRHPHRAFIPRGGANGRSHRSDFISYERLCRVADCFSLLLAASMWIMRMVRDDPRSHYEAFYFADLVARPTLVASMHRSFDHQRSIVLATNVITERLGKAKAMLGVYPGYIPDWASCGIGFAHDASIKGPEDAKRLDWLGSGPPDDDNKGEGKDDA